jgi:hypothetical protein
LGHERGFYSPDSFSIGLAASTSDRYSSASSHGAGISIAAKPCRDGIFMLFLGLSGLVVLIMLGSIACFRLWPNAALAVAGGLWLLYALYEYLMYRRILCSGDCNIRVDLLVIYPMLLSITLAAVGRVLWVQWKRER